ncbi:MAG: helix-turn-helix domain-containing protein [Nitrososphaerota archaeon]|nr:helix-turn-helix domain-containing protein [Nitrososphaerota archaeon]
MARVVARKVDLDRVRRLVERGQSQSEIAAALGVDPSTISRALKRLDLR